MEPTCLRKAVETLRLERATRFRVAIDAALQTLFARHRTVELDASYAAYDEHPLGEPDAWGDLASFREAAAAS